MILWQGPALEHTHKSISLYLDQQTYYAMGTKINKKVHTIGIQRNKKTHALVCPETKTRFFIICGHFTDQTFKTTLTYMKYTPNVNLSQKKNYHTMISLKRFLYSVGHKGTLVNWFRLYNNLNYQPNYKILMEIDLSRIFQ